MPQPHLYLVDNTRPPDPTLPDLYDGIADESRKSHSLPLFATDFAEKAQKVASRALGVAFWVALGLCVGVLVL